MDKQKLNNQSNLTPKELYKKSIDHLKNGDASGALSILEQAQSLPSSKKIEGPIHYNLAVCHQRLGNSDKVLEELRRAVKINGWLAAEARKDADFNSLRNSNEFIEIFNTRNPMLSIFISWVCAVSLIIGIIWSIRYFILRQGYEGAQALGLPIINGLVVSIPLSIGAPSLIYWFIHLLVGPAIGIYFFAWLRDRRSRKVSRPSKA